MKKQKKLNIKKIITSTKFRVNKDLDKYENVVLFPEKLALANKLLKGVKLPTGE